MAFPWSHQETFDDGTRGNFDAETDASSILDFPHYQELARHGLAPWQGSHALRVALAATATANIQENAGFDAALAATIHVWFPVLIAENVTLSDGDEVILFAMVSAAANECVVGVDRSGDDYRLFCGETGATNTLVITRSNKRWYQVEFTLLVNAGAGTIDFYVDGGAVGSQITGLTGAAVTHAQVGAVSGTAAGNAGTILIGGVIADDARVYPRERFPLETFWVTRDICAFVGPGTIDAASVTGTSTDAVMTLLDTDIYSSTGVGFTHEPSQYIRNVTANDQAPGFNTPTKFSKGCYVQLTGTNPQGFVSIKSPSSVVKSSANYVDRGLRRKPPR